MRRATRQNPRPRFGKIPTAVTYSGVCRSKLYQAAADHPDLFRKHGKSTLVDFDVLDRVLDKLTMAKIQPLPKPPAVSRRPRAK